MKNKTIATLEKDMLILFNKYFTPAELIDWVTKANEVIYQHNFKQFYEDPKLLNASYFMSALGDLIKAVIVDMPGEEKKKFVMKMIDRTFRNIDTDDIKYALAEIGSTFLVDQVKLNYFPGDAGKFLHRLACLADLADMRSDYETFLEYNK